MGYYTQYVFTLEEGPEEQYRSMTREIDGILSCDDLSLYESVYAKWYGRRLTASQAPAEKHPVPYCTRYVVHTCAL
mgnify:CR=1 FL=1